MRITLGWLRPFPWREATHLALGLFTGLALFTSLVVAVVLSPLVVFLPVVSLAALVIFVRLGRLEPARFRVVLGEEVPVVSPDASGLDRHARWRALVADPGVLRLAAYSLVRAPLAVLEVAIFTVVFTWPIVMLATAVRAVATGVYPGGGPFVGGSGLMLAVGIGVAVLLVLVVTVGGPMVMRQLARMDLVVTRALLGRLAAELQVRVGELVTARSRVVGAAEAERARI